MTMTTKITTTTTTVDDLIEMARAGTLEDAYRDLRDRLVTIEKLTPEQEAKIAAERKRYCDLATSTAPADRKKAETAVRELADIAGVQINRVVWVNSPKEGRREHDAAWSSLMDSLRDSLGASLRASLWDSLSASLSASLRDALRDSLRDALSASLWDSLWDSLRASLWDSLRASLWDSLWDTGWLAFYAIPRDILGVEYAKDAQRKLDLWIATLESCFAVWIVPGTAILCERPATVEIVDGKLVGLTWRKLYEPRS
jgi:hypothetical protein